MATLISGTAISKEIRAEIKEECAKVVADFGIQPGLAVVLVGSRRDSAAYVRSKKKACAEIGINSVGIDLPETVSEADLIAEVDKLNADESIHGILVQLPLPEHINEDNVLDRVDQRKDVDGLHPLNVYQVNCTKQCYNTVCPSSID
jgi:5,10-methylene-tetrahydrofolate dehydrogenase/methenyl tetrahydrofolate cyclohydrolase